MESKIYELCNDKVISEIDSDYNNYTGIITLYKKGYLLIILLNILLYFLLQLYLYL